MNSSNKRPFSRAPIAIVSCLDLALESLASSDVLGISSWKCLLLFFDIL